MQTYNYTMSCLRISLLVNNRHNINFYANISTRCIQGGNELSCEILSLMHDIEWRIMLIIIKLSRFR